MLQSIHRALSELKTIDSRIDKTIQSLEPVGYQQDKKLVNGFYDVNDFNKNVKSKFDSINDLISRKNVIKSAIVKANNTTIVTIGGKQMTISDAINYKTVIDRKKKLLEHLKQKNAKVKADIEKRNTDVNKSALELATSALEKDNVKISDTDAIAITEPYLKKNLYARIDPLNIEKVIEDMELEIYSFESEVDATLSEINAITQVDI